MTKMVDLACAEAWRTLQAVGPALPREEDLQIFLVDLRLAEARGYFLPDEDERLREIYRQYLSVRVSLWEMVGDLKPLLDGRVELVWEERLRVFGLAFCAAAMLVRSASFLVKLAADRPLVWRKLDEAEGRYGILEKSFTRVYKNLSSARWMWRYHEAWRFYECHKTELQAELTRAGMGSLVIWLREEEPFFEKRRRDYLQRRIRYRLHSFHRRNEVGFQRVMFHFFKMGGSAVAEMRHPFVKKRAGGTSEKRVPSRAREALASLMRAGDVLVTRHDDAMSNLFLPGYWPHAALCVGQPEERAKLGLQMAEERARRCEESVRFLEAKKDGVLFRRLEETLAVDAVVLLRPRLPDAVVAEALTRAMSHEGKLYDFVFDFRQSDRLVCTELVYRAYHGLGGVTFELSRRSGRLCLSAEDFLQQGLAGGFFEVVACFGVEDDLLRLGDAARRRLMASLRKFGG